MLKKKIYYSLLIFLFKQNYLYLFLTFITRMRSIYMKKIIFFLYKPMNLMQFSILTKKLAYNYLIRKKTKSGFLKKKLTSYKKSLFLNKFTKLTKQHSFDFLFSLRKFSNLLLNIGFCGSNLLFIGTKSLEYEIFLFNLWNQNLFNAIQNSACLQYIVATKNYSSFYSQPGYCFLLEPKVVNLRNILTFRNKTVPILGIGTEKNSSFIYDKIFYVSRINRSVVYAYFVAASNYYFLGLSISKQYHFENFTKQYLYLYLKHTVLLKQLTNAN